MLSLLWAPRHLRRLASVLVCGLVSGLATHQNMSHLLVSLMAKMSLTVSLSVSKRVTYIETLP